MNYRDPDDPISKIGTDIGKSYIVPPNQNRGILTPFGTIPAHRLQNMGDATNPIPINEYKKKHRGFISNIDEAEITNHNIGQLDSDTFKAYENTLNERLARGGIIPDNEVMGLKARGGIIYVQPYERSDGTRVSGYYRSA